MNSLTVAGQLGRDAEVRYLPDGTPVCGFSVADNQGRDKAPIWWACALYGKRVESLAKYLTKGQSVTVTGAVSERVYTDKQGNERKAMEVRVQDVALQGGKRESQPAPQEDRPAASKPHAKQGSGFDDMDDDIPF